MHIFLVKDLFVRHKRKAYSSVQESAKDTFLCMTLKTQNPKALTIKLEETVSIMP